MPTSGKKKKKKRGKRNCVWTENFRKAGPSSAFGPHSTSATSLSLTAARSSCFFPKRSHFSCTKEGGGETRKNEKAAECEGNACVLARLKLLSNNQPRLLCLAVVWFSFVGSTKALGGPGSLREIIYNSLARERG